MPLSALSEREGGAAASSWGGSRAPSAHLEEVGRLLLEHADICAGRVDTPSVPSWVSLRGWSAFLLGLDEAQVTEAEREQGAALAHFDGAPPSLRAFVEAALSVSRVAVRGGVAVPTLRGAGVPKRAQVGALRAFVESTWLSRRADAPRRVVDLGAGRGHLTRALADALGVPAIGIERRQDVVRVARSMTEGGSVRFEVRDAIDHRVVLQETDLLVGLHACGVLGDALVQYAVESGCAAMLVPCCPQKVPGPGRAPLSRVGQRLNLFLSRERLGLANLAAVASVRVSHEDALARRRTRYAVRLLLRDAGVDVAPGEESLRVNRRRFRRPLAEVTAHVFEKRGLALPSVAQMRDAEQRAAHDHGRMRRLELPRAVLARPLELAVALDRAAALEDLGRSVCVVELFDRRVSPRNLAIAAHRGERRSG